MVEGDGRPASLNFWIPVTEATPDNGCMYILPKGRDSNYWEPDDTLFAASQAHIDFQDLRALVAEPGTCLFCDGYVWVGEYEVCRRLSNGNEASWALQSCAFFVAIYLSLELHRSVTWLGREGYALGRAQQLPPAGTLCN